MAGMGVDFSGNQVQFFTQMQATQICFLYQFPVLKQRTEQKIANRKSGYLPYHGFDLASKKGKERGEKEMLLRVKETCNTFACITFHALIANFSK